MSLWKSTRRYARAAGSAIESLYRPLCENLQALTCSHLHGVEEVPGPGGIQLTLRQRLPGLPVFAPPLRLPAGLRATAAACIARSAQARIAARDSSALSGAV